MGNKVRKGRKERKQGTVGRKRKASKRERWTEGWQEEGDEIRQNKGKLRQNKRERKI